jgi:hypothetical protein
MKKPIITILFTILTIITYGQDYFPLIEENKTWNVLAVAFQPPFDTSFSTITYKVSGIQSLILNLTKKYIHQTKRIQRTGTYGVL